MVLVLLAQDCPVQGPQGPQVVRPLGHQIGQILDGLLGVALVVQGQVQLAQTQGVYVVGGVDDHELFVAEGGFHVVPLLCVDFSQLDPGLLVGWLHGHIAVQFLQIGVNSSLSLHNLKFTLLEAIYFLRVSLSVRSSLIKSSRGDSLEL